MTLATKNKIVIGGSSGALTELKKILGGLDPKINAALFVVLHLPTNQVGSRLDIILSEHCRLPVTFAKDGERFESGRVYLAPPNRHLLVSGDAIKLSVGPRENRARPAIDTLFRSAAVNFGAATVSVILSGLLDDGSAGVVAVKECGGSVIILNPEDAQYQDMPESALDSIKDKVDFILKAHEIPAVIQKLATTPAGSQPDIPESISLEASICQTGRSSIELQNHLGEDEPFICPDCDGPLWQMNDNKMVRFRCHTGHAVTAKVLADSQSTNIEYTLWSAVRQFEERAKMLQKLLKRSSQRNPSRVDASMQQKYEETKKNAQDLRNFLFSVQRASSSNAM